MIYSTPEFFILFVLTSLLFLLVDSYWFRFVLLISVSLIFYSWSSFFDTVIFFFVVLISWACAWAMNTYPPWRKFFLAFGISVMALHLFFWKYATWLSGEVQKLYPDFLGGYHVNLPLPVGISFFTLQGMAYLIDFHSSAAGYMPFPRYLLYKSFFAQLVAGPIVRFPELEPQLRRLGSPKYVQIFDGLALFGLGFFKKICIADRCSIFVDDVFFSIPNHNRATLLTALLGYTIQIWADFSGYTDMGRGCAKILGIELPENFLAPYFSKSPSEFWRRWHITLGRWIRDFIYIPLGGGRGSILRVVSVGLLTMAISGLWHGANWTFLVWGLYHGLLLAGDRLFRRLGIWKDGIVSGILTFIAVVFGWLIFRAQNLGDVKRFIEGVLVSSNTTLAGALDKSPILIAAFICLCLHIGLYYNFGTKKYALSDLRHKLIAEISPKVRQNRLTLVAGGTALGLILAAVFFAGIFFRAPLAKSSFIYFQF
jgi:alginate O-acetyltransferase complex protein AlgI